MPIVAQPALCLRVLNPCLCSPVLVEVPSPASELGFEDDSRGLPPSQRQKSQRRRMEEAGTACMMCSRQQGPKSESRRKISTRGFGGLLIHSKRASGPSSSSLKEAGAHVSCWQQSGQLSASCLGDCLGLCCAVALLELEPWKSFRWALQSLWSVRLCLGSSMGLTSSEELRLTLGFLVSASACPSP